MVCLDFGMFSPFMNLADALSQSKLQLRGSTILAICIFQKSVIWSIDHGKMFGLTGYQLPKHQAGQCGPSWRACKRG